MKDLLRAYRTRMKTAITHEDITFADDSDQAVNRAQMRGKVMLLSFWNPV